MVNLLNLPKAYVEVLEVLQFFPQKAYIKIPTEKIKFFERNKDKTYDIKLKSKEDLRKKKLLKETKIIVIQIIREYIATSSQRKKIDDILKLNDKKGKNENI